MPTLAELLTLKSQDTIETEILSTAAGRGMPTTVWSPTGVAPTIIAGNAKAMVALYEGRVAVASGGYLYLASGKWLTLLAQHVFREARSPAVFAEGNCRLTAISGAGPYTITAGQLWATSTSGKLFTNVTGGTLSQGGTLTLRFKAERSGLAYNVANNTITTLKTPIAGVSITNPAGDGSWLVVQGQDEEGDASLQDRCANKWASLGVGMTADAWRYWARKASSQVTRVLVESTPYAETLLTLAGVSGAIDSGLLTEVDAYLQLRRTTGTYLTTQNATNRTVAITGTVYYYTGHSAAQGYAETALLRYQGAIDISGTVTPSTVVREQIDSAIMKAPTPQSDGRVIALNDGKVRDIAITSPTGNVNLNPGEVAVFDYTGLVWTPV